MKKLNKRAVGSAYENKAKEYLVSKGVDIIKCNYHFHKTGEIDIIYYDNEFEGGNLVKYLCFCEVKYRKSESSGSAIEAVDYRKRKNISKVAMGFVKQHNISMSQPMRFDIVTIDGDNINWIKNAFFYVQ
ncbi:MAG: YraN family protein [Lachnospiraceae bacterium]|nr:YraN family protein [Lachnospiraceae bacterium]